MFFGKRNNFPLKTAKCLHQVIYSFDRVLINHTQEYFKPNHDLQSDEKLGRAQGQPQPAVGNFWQLPTYGPKQSQCENMDLNSGRPHWREVSWEMALH